MLAKAIKRSVTLKLIFQFEIESFFIKVCYILCSYSQIVVKHSTSYAYMVECTVRYSDIRHPCFMFYGRYFFLDWCKVIL